MRGIAGIFNLSGDPVNPGLLRGMTEGVPRRSASPAQCWARDRVGFSILSFYGQCPAISNPAGDCWINADVRVDNREDIISSLAAKGLYFQNPTDPELILAAYDCWGVFCPQHIAGDFAFVIWDTREQRLLGVRDRMGTQPFYYHYEPAQHFLWASQCRQLLRHPGVGKNLHEGMVGAHLVPCPGQADWSFFADIAQLPPAHLLCLDRSGLHIERYWDIDPRNKIRYRHDQEYEEHFLTLFRETVNCRLRNAGPTGILLSGGLDSGSIASVAGDCVRQDGAALPDARKTLRSFSWAFEELSECDERHYSDQIVAACGLESIYIPADDHWLLSDYYGNHPVADDPTLLMCPPLLRATLERAREVGVVTMLTGGGGNSLVGGNRPIYVDLLRGFRWRALGRDLARQRQIDSTSWPRTLWRHVVRPALPAFLQHAIDRFRQTPRPQQPDWPDWIAPAFARRVGLKEIKQIGRAWRPFGRPSRLLRYQSVVNELETRTAVTEKQLYAEYDLDLRLPWRDARLFEFIMAIPADQVWRGGKPKDIVRRTMRGLLPEGVRTSSHIGSIQPLRTLGLRDRGRPMIAALLEKPLLAQYGFVEGAALQAEYHRYCAGLRGEYPLNYALALELWLRQLYA